MGWNAIESISDVDALSQASQISPQLIFKHSTRCGTSTVAKNRLDSNISVLEKELTLHFLDLLEYRGVSNHIAQRFDVHHESPQVLLIINGECVLEQSHFGVSPAEIVSYLADLKKQA